MNIRYDVWYHVKSVDTSISGINKDPKCKNETLPDSIHWTWTNLAAEITYENFLSMQVDCFIYNRKSHCMARQAIK